MRQVGAHCKIPIQTDQAQGGARNETPAHSEKSAHNADYEPNDDQIDRADVRAGNWEKHGLSGATANKTQQERGYILKNDSLAEVKFEQQDLGYPVFGCDLAPIDFVALARACGADGFRCARPDEVRPAIDAALRSPRPALVEAIVDPDERPARPDGLRA